LPDRESGVPGRVTDKKWGTTYVSTEDRERLLTYLQHLPDSVKDEYRAQIGEREKAGRKPYSWSFKDGHRWTWTELWEAQAWLRARAGEEPWPLGLPTDTTCTAYDDDLARQIRSAAKDSNLRIGPIIEQVNAALDTMSMTKVTGVPQLVERFPHVAALVLEIVEELGEVPDYDVVFAALAEQCAA